MFDIGIYLQALIPLSVIAVALWIYSLIKHDVSIVDSFWSLMILAAGIYYFLWLPDTGAHAVMVLGLALLWALRLNIYISWRNWGEGEDHRYQTIRKNNEPHFQYKSLYIVFGLQAVLAWIVSLPLLGAIANSGHILWLEGLGVTLWLIGFVFESVGDYQLAQFKSNPDNKGKVMDRGLWRYTRHPNYFGEACIWWGFYLIALSAGAWWAIASPILMTILLLRVSGVSLLEQTISERRPAYRDYILRTNAFIPGPPHAPRHNSQQGVSS